MKKIISILIAVMLVAANSANVFAHGHGRRAVYSASYSCGIQDCTNTGRHTHNSYAAHYFGGGHAHHNAERVHY